MSSTLTGFTVFESRTTIRSSEVNTNFSLIKDRGGFWSTFTLSASSLSIAGQTQTGTLLNLEPGECVTAYAVKHSANFTGGSVASLLFSVGAGSDSKRFVEQFNIFADSTSTSYESQDCYIGSFDTTVAVTWLAESTGSTLDSLTAGLLEVYIQSSKAKA